MCFCKHVFVCVLLLYLVRGLHAQICTIQASTIGKNMAATMWQLRWSVFRGDAGTGDSASLYAARMARVVRCFRYCLSRGRTTSTITVKVASPGIITLGQVVREPTVDAVDVAILVARGRAHVRTARTLFRASERSLIIVLVLWAHVVFVDSLCSAGNYMCGPCIPSACSGCGGGGGGNWCPMGDYSNAAKYMTDAGYYSAAVGGNRMTSHGDGPCNVGYYCAAGSAIATQYIAATCPSGSYCPVGLRTALPCSAGYYGSSTGQRLPTCSGICSAGYYCGAGSTSATQYTAATCPVGSYCAAGTTAVQPCPAGRYGSTVGLTSAICTGACTAGYFCAAGSTFADQIIGHTYCNAGLYCSAPQNGVAASPCLPGFFGDSEFVTVSTCAGACDDGFFCASGSVSPQQYTSTTCPLGYYCAPGTRVPMPCQPGYWASSGGQTAPTCSGPCHSGNFCAAGSLSQTQYTAGTCPAGMYCFGGTVAATPCPPGYYGATTGLSSPTCTGKCSAGSWCTSGSTSATQYSSSSTCPMGYFCATGTTAATPCPAGFYGALTGLTSSSCSGACTMAYFCTQGSVVATQFTSTSCPAGYYCAPGSQSALPCAPGFYGAVGGLSSPVCSGACQQGQFCPSGMQRHADV